MKNKIITILSVVVFAEGFFVLYFSGPVKQVIPVVDSADQQLNNFKNWESKIDEQASVVVTVTPIDILSESGEWKFDIIINTHSVELDQNMTKIAILVDDQDKEYKSLRWEGAEAGGHHREGMLIFNQITPIPKYVELKIYGIGDVVRSFSW